jgi:PhoPQ-activated pathogenicity-related protein
MRAVLGVLAVLAVTVGASNLWDYVNADDPAFHWEDTGYRVPNVTGWTGYLLNVTSGNWLDKSRVDITVWTHQLLVVVPDNMTITNRAALYITGGCNNAGPPKADDEDLLLTATLAVENQMIAATLFQIPNCPLHFPSDPTHAGRSEDAAVAYTWYEFMKHLDEPEWILYWPMTRAASRALTTITEFAATLPSKPSVERFVVAGASKRGWITWLTGATDDRVDAIAPIVMDMLNFTANVRHMYKSYGGWTFAFEDYYAMNLTETFDTPEFAVLGHYIDPLTYAANLTMPKLVIDATGDEFFMPDDDWYWWGNNGAELPGETYRLMVSNAEHSMATGIPTVLEGMNGFVHSINYNGVRPNLTWTTDRETGVITATTNVKPDKAVLRFATTTSCDRRDFRLIKGDTPADPFKFIPVKIFGKACINPIIWIGEDLAPTSQDEETGLYTYVGSQPLPPVEEGWRGFFIDFYYPAPRGTTYRLTTQISIIPNTYPFPPCHGEGCKGVLV